MRKNLLGVAAVATVLLTVAAAIVSQSYNPKVEDPFPQEVAGWHRMMPKVISDAQASQGGMPAAGGFSQIPVLAKQWEQLGTPTDGGAITSPVFDLYNVFECTVVADNSLGGSSRTLKVDYLGSDGTTVLYEQAITVTNGTRALANIGSQSSSAATLPTGVTVIPAAPGRRMSFTLAAAGTAAGSLAVYCR